jgi:O-antigen ligase
MDNHLKIFFQMTIMPIKNPVYLFSALISLLLITTFSYLDYSVTALLMLLSAIWVLRIAIKRETFERYSMTNIMLFYLFWLFVVTFTSQVYPVSNASLVVLIGMPLMYLVATNFPDFAQSWKTLRVVLVVLAALLSMTAIWQVTMKIGNGYASGPFNDRNAFAALLNLLWFPIAYLFFVAVNRAAKCTMLALVCVLLLMGVAFFATSSRGGILTWMLLLPILLWVGYRHNKSAKAVALVLVISAIAYFVSDYVLHSSIAERSFNVVQDASSHARLQIWEASLKMALDHPLIGTGWGTFGYFYPAFRLPIEKGSAGFFAHNDYLQYASEGGLIATFILLGILGLLLLKLKAQVNRTDAPSFESVALLLGVLALFIHAIVNFIFYFAFMSSVAGLYLARVAMLSETATAFSMPKFANIRPSVKKLLSGFVILVIAIPYVVNIIAQLCLAESRPGLKAINLVAPSVTAFDVANLITAVYPNDGLAQEYMLRTYEYYLTENGPYVNKLEGAPMLNDAVNNFDAVRKKYANGAPYGTREVKFLLANQATYDAITKVTGSAITKAYQVLSDNLRADPYHGYSWVMLARLQSMEGKKQEAMATLNNAYFTVLIIRDQQLVMVERLRQLGMPKIYPELDAIEAKLLLIKSNAPEAITHQDEGKVYQSVEAKLNEIAGKIESDIKN